MHDKLSLQKSSLKGSDMNAAIAAEARSIVREVAAPTATGKGVGAQIYDAWRTLSAVNPHTKLPHWRVRSAWYEDAGCWSAAALEDLRNRYAKWRAKEEGLARAERNTAIARIASVRETLAAADTDFHRAEIHRLGQLLDELRGEAAKRGLTPPLDDESCI